MARALDRIDLMRLFLRIAETGSLSAAARALGLSQPSASRQLRALETELGAVLVARSTRGLTLTEAGIDLLDEARTLVGRWEALGERLGGEGALSGRLRVLAPLGLGQGALADLAGRFLARHPGVALDWRLDDAARDLATDAIDVWLRVGRVTDETLIARPAAPLSRVVVAARGTAPVGHPSALSQRPAVTLAPYMAARMVLEGPDGARAETTVRPAVTTDNLFAASRLTAAGAGWSMLPDWLVSGDLARGDLVRLCPDWRPAPLTLWVAYPRTRFRPARARAFVDLVLAEAPARLAGPTTAREKRSG